MDNNGYNITSCIEMADYVPLSTNETNLSRLPRKMVKLFNGVKCDLPCAVRSYFIGSYFTGTRPTKQIYPVYPVKW